MPSPNGTAPFRAFTRPRTGHSVNSSDDSVGHSSDDSDRSRVDRFLHDRLGRRLSNRTNRTSRQSSFSSKKFSQSEDIPNPSTATLRSLSQKELHSDDGGGNEDDDDDADEEIRNLETAELKSVRFNSNNNSQMISPSLAPSRSLTASTNWNVKPRKNILGRSIYEQFVWSLDNDPKWQAQKNQTRAIGYYKLYGELGSGNFSKVKLGVHMLTREKVAVKIIDRSKIESKFEKMLSREVATMDSVNHPHIIRLFEVIDTPMKIFLVTEWAPAGDLYSKVTLAGKLTEAETKMYFRQVLSAVSYLHTNGMIHRDIKAENIFFSSANFIKVGDFGFATVARRGQLLTTFCGSPPYAAPELFRDASYEGPPVDIWSMGILLYFMLNGFLPFNGSSIPVLKKAILDGKFYVADELSKDVVDLLFLMLKQIPCRRPTTSEVIRHPWLRLGTMGSGLTRSFSTSVHSLNSNNEPKSPSSKLDCNLIFIRRESTNIVLPASQDTKKSLPTEEQAVSGILSSAEVQALQVLNEIGIDGETIDTHRAKGPRSPITGIYRLILHSINEGRGWTPRDFIVPCTINKAISTTNVFKTTLLGLKKNSVMDATKACYAHPHPRDKSSICCLL